MSYSNQSYLRFTLEESIWFQKGQEVAELVSISLDPSITIQESDQYVTIKGSLELSGEYNREDIDEVEEVLDYFSNPKFVQSVDVREEGVYLFSHHFPVEITIPKNRIENVFDIDVAVETFDYAFPERSCLKLSADLMISGLYGELQHERSQQQDEIEDVEEDEEIEEIDDREEESASFYTPFEIEARKEPVIESLHSDPEPKQDDHFAQFRNEKVKVEDSLDENDMNHEQADIESEDHQSENEPMLENSSPAEIEENEISEDEIEVEPEPEPEKKTSPEITFSAKRNEQQQPSLPVEEVMDELEEAVENSGINEEEEESAELDDESAESESATPQGKKGKDKKHKWKNKQSYTLSEFFARKDEEAHTKLKVVIVQNGDSLNSLSERYHVPVAQLQKVNQIELNHDISEGQVLYIPIAQTQR